MSVIHMHDFQFFVEVNEDGYSHGDLPGLAFYPDRSVLFPGICYLNGEVGKELLMEYHQTYLRSFGLGADAIRFVQGKSLFEGLLADEDQRAELIRELSNGSRLEAFCATDSFESFVKQLGIDRSRILTPVPKVMKEFDDKASIRGKAYEMNRGRWFPFNYSSYCSKPECFDERVEDLKKDVKHILRRFPKLVIFKRSDLESGVGQLRITPSTPEEVIEKHLHLFAKGKHRVILEEGVFGHECSVQWYVTNHHTYKQVFVSAQYIEDQHHTGNMIAADPKDCFPKEWSEKDRQSVVDRLWLMTEPFVKQAAQKGFVGTIGFDAIARPERVVLLECNARVTAATYLESVRSQIVSRFGQPVCVAMRSTKSNGIHDWKQIVRRLNQRNIGFCACHGLGVIVANPRQLMLEDPKCLLISVGHSVEETESQLLQAIQCL